MDQWNYGRASQQQGGYQSGSFGPQAGAASSGGSQYGFSQPNYGQGYGPQILGKSDDYQGSAGIGSSMGLYNLDSKYSSSGYGSAAASTTPFAQKSDSLKRYSESQLDQQAIRQQQLLQSALRQGTAPSGLDSGVRSQVDYLSAGRNSALPAAVGGGYGGGRELLGSTYRPEAEVALLGSQSSIASRGVLPFPSQAADPLGSLTGARGILGPMYPPASGYSSMEIGSTRSGISAMSDFAGIGSSRYDDLLEDRMALRYDYERREDDRVRERDRSRERDRFRDRERDRDRERSRERERERERERLREKERAWERERARERERVREKELRDREREVRRRERTPPRPVAPPPRRDEKIIRKASPPPPRFSSPIKPRKPEYLCKVEPFSLIEAERDLLSLIRRYPKLFVAADFSKAVTCWRETSSEISLNHPVSFEIDAVEAEEESEAKEGAVKSPEGAETLKGSITWTVKVMLMSGMSDDNVKELLSDSEDRPLHMHNILKFAVLRKERSALMAIGGTWDKVLDGGDPAIDEHALICTAIRCTKDATQLDLHGVHSWTRFMEIHYDRVGENDMNCKEISVFLIPDLSGILPSLETWKLEWKQRKKESKHRRETSQKHDKDAKAEESHKGNANGGIDAASEGKETEEKKAEGVKVEAKKDEKFEKDGKKESKKDDPKKEDRKQKDTKKEEKKDLKEDKKEKDTKKDDKKPDLKKDGKAKTDRKDKEKKDEEKKEEKDGRITKDKTADKKTKSRSEDEPPATPGVFITTKRTKSDRVRGMAISLDGLLDYDERDKEESTFELSLFAEFFQEMLQYRFGCQIWESFEALHPLVQARKKEDRKRARENDKDSKLSTKKKSKFADKAESSEKPNKDGENAKLSLDDETEKKGIGAKDDEQKAVKDIDAAMQEASLINLDELEEESQDMPDLVNNTVADEKTVQDGSEQKKTGLKFITNENLFKAFRYFDRNKAGYLRAEDVRRLVHVLGKFLTRRRVKDVTSSAIIESKSKDDFIYYRRLVEKEVV